MDSVWLREEEEDWGRNKEAIQVLGPKTRDSMRSLGQNRNIDPILGFNLEGQSSIFKKDDFSYTLMDHDIQDRVLTVEEGNKRARGRVNTVLQRKRIAIWRKGTKNWNVWGLGSPRTVHRLRHWLRLYIPHIVFFMETKIDRRRME
ncbi:hypothetical protein E1A91_D11G280000v1 [Gossypium mustelinum]|uniref:Uncharacterized protein n=1 Tax=Gossypium mustelinum TaxID=34275 RepID=A0A5D2SY57_GOSMU|nr:hypothetical protein E1A91_D11G280000v1 [Gossypium mustelinum]